MIRPVSTILAEILGLAGLTDEQRQALERAIERAKASVRDHKIGDLQVVYCSTPDLWQAFRDPEEPAYGEGKTPAEAVADWYDLELDRLEDFRPIPFYLELHVTLPAADRALAEPIGLRHGFHWSQIEGDETLGAGTRGYLTRSIKTATAGGGGAQLLELCSALEEAGLSWQRRKIEAVTHDERRA